MSHSFAGTYTKADIAAALLHMQCKELAHFGINIARRRHVTSVVYAGSFVDVPLTQQILQECFLSETLHLPLLGVSRVRAVMFSDGIMTSRELYLW